MASLCRDKNGGKRILFMLRGRRKCIRLGAMPVKAAQTVKAHVEALVYAAESNTAPDADTAAWVAGLEDSALFGRLVALGLVAARPRQEGDMEQPAGPTLGDFLTEHVKRRIDVKPATKEVWGQVVRNLKDCFGETRELATIDEGAAEDFKMYLVGQGLAPTTVHKRLQFARGFFRAALKRKLVASNPFAEVTAKAVMRDRGRFVTPEETARLLEVCPNVDWRAIVALARYGGLRCPSEVLSLEWQGVDWAAGRMRVESPKTAHHPGKGSRLVPLFPELRAILAETFDAAPEGARYVVGGPYRAVAMNPKGWQNVNLRTQFERIIRRAGLQPWPRLFHNLRASRETELAQEYPVHVVTAWLGNSPRIAMKHYLMTTEADFQRAAAGSAKRGAKSGALEAQNAAQPASADICHHPQETPQALGNKGFRQMVADDDKSVDGDDRTRTGDPRLAKVVSGLTQLPRYQGLASLYRPVSTRTSRDTIGHHLTCLHGRSYRRWPVSTLGTEPGSYRAWPDTTSRRV